MSQAIGTPLTDAPELCRLSAQDLSAGFAAKAFSPVEVTRQALHRCDETQQAFNAFTHISHERALAAALASEARWRQGAPLSPYDGVPATIKDIVSVQGWMVRHGSTLTPAENCAQDAPSVARMRAAGLVFLGLTTTPEFGWKAVTDSPLSGVTRNPWNAALTPGGSSGGAAVAAATGAGVFHLGTDGGGSIRIPAAFTGTAGLKPTFGRVAAFPASPFGTIAHIGPMGRSPQDVEALLSIMSGRDLADWFQGAAEWPRLDPRTVPPKGKKIGVWTTPPSGQTSPGVARQFDKTLADLADAGAELIAFDLPMRDQLQEMFNWHWTSGARRRLDLLGQVDSSLIDPDLYQMAEVARGWTAADYIGQVTARAGFGSAMNRALAGLDFIVSPAVSVLPFEAGKEWPPGSHMSRWIEWAGFSYPINLSQHPAMSVPAGHDESGLQHAVQIIGALGADSEVLGLAKWWHHAHPEFFL